MQVTIREVVIDTETEEDVVIVAANVTQIVRAWVQTPRPALASHQISAAPATPAPRALAAPVEGEAAAGAGQPAPPTPEKRNGRRAANGHKAGKEMDVCACGQPKLARSVRCRKCAGKHAREVRASRQ